MFVDDVAHQPVDDNESERTIEQGLHRPKEDDQAMDLVGDKSGDVNVGVGAVQMMQVDGMFFFYCWIFFRFCSLIILSYFHECRRRCHCF